MANPSITQVDVITNSVSNIQSGIVEEFQDRLSLKGIDIVLDIPTTDRSQPRGRGNLITTAPGLEGAGKNEDKPTSTSKRARYTPANEAKICQLKDFGSRSLYISLGVAPALEKAYARPEKEVSRLGVWVVLRVVVEEAWVRRRVLTSAVRLILRVSARETVPKLVAPAEEYARTAYRILVGEDGGRE
ncbi:hypothetical protein F5144DRAFT_630994 [Chaetomium tenue]|uniref:Uncharacterized protein n=1 Tax=Chaetomium tenue TaxID=1854479 RepID=A0ACB7P1B2_9PEZI|nr:hypothetical protein F5144DRAFT_630994 [Chaetomium globosum]